MALIDVAEHAMCCVVSFVPKQPVEPGDVIFRAENLFVPGQKSPFFAQRKISFNPGPAQHLLPLGFITGAIQRFAEPHHAVGGDGFLLGEPVQDVGIRRRFVHRFFEVLTEDVAGRPIRILGDESGALAETDAGIGLHHLEPGNGFGEKRVVGTAGQSPRIAPLSVIGGGVRVAVNPFVAGGKGGGRCRKGAQERSEYQDSRRT